MKIVDVPVEAIRATEANPNEMSEAQYQALKRDLEEHGYAQPVVVRPVEPDSANPAIRYQLIDGEHRWRALCELGAQSIPCVVDEQGDEAEGLVRTVSMNRLRGSFVPIKLAHLLADLTSRHPAEEVAERLALEPADMANMLELESFLNDGEDKAERSSQDDDEAKRSGEVAVICKPAQAGQIRELLDERTEGDAKREPSAILAAARQYLREKR